jgi:hypothetical protein
MLINRGADTSICLEDGRSILFLAIGNFKALMFGGSGSRFEIVKRLLDHGVEINTKTDINMTPLMNAVTWGDRRVVRELLSRGADTTESGSRGDALQYAEISARLHEYPDEQAAIVDDIRHAIERRAKCHSFAMGQQERLGVNSRVRFLDPGVVRMIVSFV